jgi:DNA repair proteins
LGRKMGNPNEIQVVNIRMVKEPSLYSTEKITSPEDVKKVIAKELATYDREVFAVLNLKTNGQPINLNICSVGTLDASVVSPREVFKSTILSNSAAFVAIHNHPSGSLNPSQEDKDVTKRLLSCSELLGVKMLDHIIVAGETGDIYSFKSEGLLDQLRPPRAVWER